MRKKRNAGALQGIANAFARQCAERAQQSVQAAIIDLMIFRASFGTTRDDLETTRQLMDHLQTLLADIERSCQVSVRINLLTSPLG